MFQVLSHFHSIFVNYGPPPVLPLGVHLVSYDIKRPKDFLFPIPFTTKLTKDMSRLV